MNCPACHTVVGRDQFHTGEWETITDIITGVAIGARRTHSIYCESCGVFTATERETGRIDDIRRIADPKRRAAVMKKIPGARFAEVCA